MNNIIYCIIICAYMPTIEGKLNDIEWFSWNKKNSLNMQFLLYQEPHHTFAQMRVVLLENFKCMLHVYKTKNLKFGKILFFFHFSAPVFIGFIILIGITFFFSWKHFVVILFNAWTLLIIPRQIQPQVYGLNVTSRKLHCRCRCRHNLIDLQVLGVFNLPS